MNEKKDLKKKNPHKQTWLAKLKNIYILINMKIHMYTYIWLKD